MNLPEPVLVLGCARTIIDGRKLEQEYLKAVEAVHDDPDLDDETRDEEEERLQLVAEMVGDAWRNIADTLIKRDQAKVVGEDLPIIFPGPEGLN